MALSCQPYSKAAYEDMAILLLLSSYQQVKHCVCARTCICTSMWRAEVEVGCLPLILFLAFETWSLTQRGSYFLVRLAGSELQVTSAHAVTLGLHVKLFRRCWSSEHRLSCSHSEPFIHWAVSQHRVRQFQEDMLFFPASFDICHVVPELYCVRVLEVLWPWKDGALCDRHCQCTLMGAGFPGRITQHCSELLITVLQGVFHHLFFLMASNLFFHENN